MRMVIDKICKMTVKGVKSKSESFFQYLMAFWSYGGKTLGGRIPLPAALIGLNLTKSCLIASLSRGKEILK